MHTILIPVRAKRIAALKDDVMQRGGSFIQGLNPFLRDVALWRAAKPDRSRVQMRAAFLHELVKLADIAIGPGWHLAGEHLLSGPGMPFGFQALPDNEPDEENLVQLADLGVTGEAVDAVCTTVQQWVSPPSPLYSFGESAPDTRLGRGFWGPADPDVVYWAGGWVENHSVRDYTKVIRVGFRGIRREIQQYLADADIADADYPQKENFWRAALHICDAGILLGQRYAELTSAMAEAANTSEEKARLRRMAEACTRVPAEGARTFFEAVQSLWLAHILTCGEDMINANSIGRLDQILYPWYRADREAGQLTQEKALELMEELACKLYLDYDVQAIVLGGVDREGHDAVNDLSYLILDATRDVAFARDVSVRLHTQSPPEFVTHAAELILRGGGIPFLFNDDCFIPALHTHGIALEDARNYAPIGCIELTIPGRANPHAVSGWFCSTKCLELALFNGQDPRTGQQLGPQTGDLREFTEFAELWDAYCNQVAFFAQRMVYHCNRGELAQRERGPLPCWSVLTDDCIARGRDITDGGAVYNYHSICFLGTANTADSMMTVKKLVFDEQQVPPEDLLIALRCNFEGYEPLRQMLLQRAPKYGNDNPEVDDLARQIDEHFIALMDPMRSPLNGRYVVHLFSFRCNLDFGKAVGATPDGRRAEEPLAYSLSAQQGRDEKGITAMLNSLAQMPHHRAAGASAAIVEIDPALVEGEAGVQRMADLITSAIAMGVGQLQWNVTTVERLKQAQADPEKYGNIVVRVAGYSQMFKLIDKELQDHIIARTKHRH
jgi:formate C-acetyltransferase